MTGPYRLSASAPARFGQAIDRSEPVGFRLDGRVLSGFYGDTLASALAASGVRTLSDSPLLGRPRGLFGLGLEDASLFALEGDRGSFAHVSGHEIILREGLRTRSAGLGLARAIRRFAPPSGPDRRALPVAQQMLERLRRSIPLPQPRLPDAEPATLARRETCDVVVVGAGLAGLAAATALMMEGLHVRVIEASWRAGGLCDLYEGAIDGRPMADWAAARIGQLRDRGALALGSVVTDIDPDGSVTVLERSSPQQPGMMTLRLYTAAAVVLATGFRERPLVFPGNDRPGVILASTARAMLRRHAIAPGARVVVATTCDEGHRAAADLRAAGVDVVMTLDERDDPQGAAVDLSKALGAPLAYASVVTGVDYDEKTGAITGVGARNRDGEGALTGARVLSAHAVVVSGGFAPRDELIRAKRLGPELGVHLANLGPNAVDAVRGGWAAAGAVAGQLGRSTSVPAPTVDAVEDEMGAAAAFDRVLAMGPGAASAFVDFGADVTIADIERAVRRRGDAPAAIARRLGLGLGADGGRQSADVAELALRALSGSTGGGPSAPRMTLGLFAARAGLRND